MDPLFRLELMLSDFGHLFKHNNANHFRTFVKGLIMTPHRGTMTQIYLSTEQKTTYWALVKFLSRSVWCVDKVASVLTRQVQSVFSQGLIIFDRGFNRRKVFTTILGQGHHLLCRAKSNAVFYYIPKQPRHPKQGRPRRYGRRVSLSHQKFRDVDVQNQTLSVTDKKV